MRHRGFTRVFMVVCLLLSSLPAAADPPAYELRAIELPVERVDSSIALAINDRGQILGSYYDGTVEQGYVYDSHGLTSLPVSDQSGLGIDDRGHIVGCAYLYVDGQFTPLGYPGARFSCAQGINNRGQIVGWYYEYDAATHGFVYERGTYIAFDVPDASATFLRDVNNLGQILGFYTTDAVHWFVLDHGEMRPIDLSAAPGAFLVVPLGHWVTRPSLRRREDHGHRRPRQRPHRGLGHQQSRRDRWVLRPSTR
jgi:probable HAF family extracellular repeat protein